jgi:Mg2+ and Co2+ transporter CorA
MQTIITYNEHEVTESNDLLKSLEIVGNKVGIDLIDPSVDVLENLRTTLNLDSKAIELYKNKNKKPQIRVLESHTFIIILDVKYKSSQTILT